MKLRTKLIVGALSLGLTCLPLLSLQDYSVVNASSNPDDFVEINEVNFPDPVFRMFVSDRYDYDLSGGLSYSEITTSNAPYLTDKYKGVGSLQGIEYLAPTTGLNLEAPTMETLDLSGFTNLTWLTITDAPNSMDVNVGNLSGLTRVIIDHSNISSLDFSGCPNLISVYVTDSGLESITFGEHQDMSNLDLTGNNLTSLDLSGMPTLFSLRAANNNLESVNFGTSPFLCEARLNGNNLTYIYISKNPKLNEALDPDFLYPCGTYGKDDAYYCFDVYVDYDENDRCERILTVDASVVIDAAEIGMSFIEPTVDFYAIDDSHFPDAGLREALMNGVDRDYDGYLNNYERYSLQWLSVDSGYVESAEGLECFENLELLSLNTNSLTSFDAGGFENLKYLTIYSDNLESLDLAGCDSLEELVIYGGSAMTSLDLSGAPNLYWLGLNGFANLPSINIGSCPALVQAFTEGSEMEDYWYNTISYTYVPDELDHAYKLVVPGAATVEVTVQSGWVNTSSGWIYYQNGSKVTGWKQISGKWYLFDANGIMKTGWQLDGGKYYYFASSGVMVTGWQKLGGVWYYFKSSGAMATGWVLDSGKWYYFKNSGAMATGWVSDGGSWYYFKSSGEMATGWVLDGGKWYYFKSSGVMATGWVKDAGVWYYFSTSGKMVTGWQQIGGKWYYFESSGAMAVNKWIGKDYVDANGVWTMSR